MKITNIESTCDLVDLLLEGLPDFSKLSDILEAAINKAHEKYIEGLDAKLFRSIEVLVPKLLKEKTHVMVNSGGDITIYLGDEGSDFPNIHTITTDEFIRDAFDGCDSSAIKPFVEKLQRVLAKALESEGQ